MIRIISQLFITHDQRLPYVMQQTAIECNANTIRHLAVFLYMDVENLSRIHNQTASLFYFMNFISDAILLFTFQHELQPRIRIANSMMMEIIDAGIDILVAAFPMIV